MDVPRRGRERAGKERCGESRRMRRGQGKEKNIDRGGKVWICSTLCCVCAAPLPNRRRESLGASSFWWMTGPLLADPGTYTGDRRAGGWKENKSGLWLCVLLLGSVSRCTYKHCRMGLAASSLYLCAYTLVCYRVLMIYVQHCTTTSLEPRCRQTARVLYALHVLCALQT